eukprot:g4299.t1
MPKHEVGSIKWLGNKMKSAGLMRLRWYCQMCQKQCRDENGFKCHQTSEVHLRNMALFCDNPEGFIDDFSAEFEKGFMQLMSTRYVKSPKIKANIVYMDFIRDRDHQHMNSTIWATLGNFVEYLVRTKQVEGEKNEQGQWLISFIDNSPEELRRRADREKEAKQRANETEKEAKHLARLVGLRKVDDADNFTKRDQSFGKVQIKLGLGGGGGDLGGSSSSSAGASRINLNAQRSSALNPSLLKQSGVDLAGLFNIGTKRAAADDDEVAEDSGDEVGVGPAKKAAKLRGPGGGLPGPSRPGTTFSTAGYNEYDQAQGRLETSAGDDLAKLATPEHINMLEQELARMQATKRGEVDQPEDVDDNGDEEDQEASASSWLQPHLVVKGTIVRLEDASTADVRMHEDAGSGKTKKMIRVPAALLETVIPKPNGRSLNRRASK